MMELAKYKICPACGERNAPSLMECRKCETDLMGVRVMDAEAEQREREEQETKERESAAEKRLMRVCDCGEKNPPQARKCAACGEDISDILPTACEAEEEKQFAYSLTAIGDEFAVVPVEPVLIVGREAALSEYLSGKNYVSRRHAQITVAADRAYIENLSSTNGTFVNNEQIADGEPTVLKDGDEIGLGGKVINGTRQSGAAYFTFRVVE